MTKAAPAEFIKMTKETASQLLEHLHVLSQEALDHADLTVLTGTFHHISISIVQGGEGMLAKRY